MTRAAWAAAPSAVRSINCASATSPSDSNTSVLGPSISASRCTQGMQRVERQPRLRPRLLRERAPLLFDLHGTRIAHRVRFGKPAQILEPSQRRATLPQHRLVEADPSPVRDGERFRESDLEVDGHRGRLAGQPLQVPFHDRVFGRELEAAAVVDRGGRDPVGRIQRVDERRGGSQRGKPLDPADVRLIDGDEHELSGVGSFVRGVMIGGRRRRGRRSMVWDESPPRRPAAVNRRR